MSEHILLYVSIYFVAVSFWAIGLAAYDKHATRCDSWRVRERTLLFVSLIGGSVAMLAPMRTIRHKTQHAKFMMGIPVITILQIAVIAFAWYEIVSVQL